MKKILLSLAAAATLTTLGVGTTATAQPWHGEDRAYQQSMRDDRGYQRGRHDERLSPAYVRSLDWRIMKEARAGHISWNRAGELKAEQRLAMQLAVQNRRGDIGRWEYGRLIRAVRTIEISTSRYAENNARPYRDYDVHRDHDGYRR